MNDAPLQRPANAAGKRISLVLAVVMHLLLAAFLIYGVRWQTATPEAVEVELVRAVPPAPTSEPTPAAEPPPEPTPPPKPEPRPAPKPEPKPEPKPLPPPPKPDIAIKEKPKEAPKPAPQPAPNPFQEQLKRETERLQQTKQFDAATAEVAKLEAARVATAKQKAVADYLAKIRGKIRGNIVLPPEVKGNPETIFDVVQLPSGEIVTVKLRRSSGVPALDAAIERAILKSSPLPKPEQASLFNRSLELKFRPLED